VTQLLLVSAVVMGLSQTLTRERIFEPLRRRLGGKDTWLGYLVSCPYCASHGIAFVLVPLTGTYAVDVAISPGPLAAVLRWFLSSILVTVIAAFLRVVFWLVDEQQALARKEKQLVEDVNGRSR
jgi:predicted membrane metal-binding protein